MVLYFDIMCCTVLYNHVLYSSILMKFSVLHFTLFYFKLCTSVYGTLLDFTIH